MNTIDIIVPCYNYARYLRQCVESILTQTGVQVRVLIIDDASPDDTAEVGTELATADRRVYFWRHEENKGHIATYNDGINWLQADCMLLISADDYLLPGALERAMTLMEADSEISLVFGRALELYPDGSTQPVLTGIRKYDDADLSIVPGAEFLTVGGYRNRVPTPTAVVRTALLRDIGGYNSALPHTADMEMWLRLAARGPIGIIGENQAVYRRHTMNMSLSYDRKYWTDIRERKAALDGLLEADGTRIEAPETLRRDIHRQFAAELVSQAHRAFDDGEGETSRRLAQYAVSLDPSVVRTGEWLRVQAKRILGRTFVRAMRTLSAKRVMPNVQ